MRVLHFFKTYMPDSMGGIERVIFQLCESSLEHGIRGEVLTLSSHPHPAEVTIAGHQVHRAKLNLHVASTGLSYSVIREFRRLAGQADLIHYHFPWPLMDLLHFLVGVRKPVVVTYHSDVVRQKFLLRLYSPLMHRFLQQADRIVVTSPNYLETSEVLRRYRHKAVTVPIGLDKSGYPQPTAERIQHWRERCGERFFLFVGVMRYYKGLHVLLEAAKGSDYPVVIVGSGPLENELKSQAQRLGLGNVKFLGQLDDDDKVALLQLCLAVAFPSHLRSEAFGISLLEGAMYGKPMISCEIGTGTSYINIHGETGLVVPPNNAMAFRAAMDQLWSNPEQSARMGRSALLRYERLFTARHMAQQMADIYKELAGRQTSS